MGLGRGDRVLVALPIVEVDAGVLFDGLDHRELLPVAKVDLMALIRDHQTSADLLGDGLHHVLDQLHHAMVVGISLIELDRGELRVVRGVHALRKMRPTS